MPLGLNSRLLTQCAVVAVAQVLLLPYATVAKAADECLGPPDVALINGKIITVDKNETIASAVRLIGNKIVRVGADPGAVTNCTKVIDLKGRTVVPGLYDAQVHFSMSASRPGHEVREAENVRSIKELQNLIRDKAQSLPAGEWIVVTEGWDPAQFQEKRWPTLAELDAAAPKNPIYMNYLLFNDAITNSAGKALLQAEGIPVGDDGRTRSGLAFRYIAKSQTFEQKVGSYTKLTKYAVSLGLTTVKDTGGGTNTAPFPIRSFDQVHGYDAAVEAWRRGAVSIRNRLNIISADRIGLENIFKMEIYLGDLQELEKRDLENVRVHLDYTYQGLGDGWLKVAGFGEHIVRYPWTGPILPSYEKAIRMLAQRGVTEEEHSMDRIENDQHLTAWENVNKEFPIADLHWSLSHVNVILDKDLARLKALGGGVIVTSNYNTVLDSLLTRHSPLAESFFARAYELAERNRWRTLVRSGTNVAAASDGATIAPLNPWLNIYTMTMGKNVADVTVASSDQTLSRMEALRIYTMGSAWTSKDEGVLGSIEIGKLADLVVLNHDYLTVPDVRDIRPVLTIVDGKVMFADASFLHCQGMKDGKWFGTRNAEPCSLDISR